MESNDASGAFMDGANGEQTSALEDQKYWTAIRQNPADFSSWTSLLQLVDQKAQTDMESVRAAYDGFLGEFPLCYIYWKRYADHESNANSPQERVVEVYERAVAAFPNSVDLWTYYATYLMDKGFDPSVVRSVFERAVDKAGTDYLAQSLWDKYLEYETAQKNLPGVTRLYTRIIALPLENLSKYYEGWKSHLKENSAGDILTDEEKDLIAGEETEDAKRSKITQSRESVYQAAQQALAKIQPYESVLKERPYFHIKPVPSEQLDVWHRYLTVQEAEGDYVKTTRLYERCLVPCCNYIVYWRRYARFLEAALGANEARRVWERAMGQLLRRRPDPYLDYALLQESQGQHAVARELYKYVLNFGHVETIMRLVQFEIRQRNFDAAISFLEAAMESPKSDAVGAYLAIQHARIILTFFNDTERARGIYSRALERYSSNKQLWLAAIDLEVNRCPRSSSDGEADVQRIIDIYQRATGDSSLLDEEAKVELWHNYLDTIHSIAPRVELVRQTMAAFMKAFPSGKPRNKKRRHDEEDASASKKAAADLAAQSAYGYGMAAYGAYGAYGAYPQATYGAWPQGAYAGYSYPAASSSTSS